MKRDFREWLLLATSVAVDAVLAWRFGSENLIVRLLLLGSGVWLTLCAVSIHSARWLPLVLHACSDALKSIRNFSAELTETFISVGRNCLRCIDFACKCRMALRNPEELRNLLENRPTYGGPGKDENIADEDVGVIPLSKSKAAD